MIVNKRYMLAEDVEGLSSSLFQANGFCHWCGSPLKRKGQLFCSAIKPVDTTHWNNPWENHRCYTMYAGLWLTIPRWKRIVMLRDNFICQICNTRLVKPNDKGIDFPDVGNIAIDHVHPYSKGGKTELNNLQVLCRPCNFKKRDKVLLTETNSI